MKMNLKSKLFLLLVFSLGYSTVVKPCTCWPYIEHFCHIVNPSHYVVTVEITDSISLDKRMVKLIENLNHEIADSTFVLLGQDGLNCGEYLEQFSIGDTLIMGLYNWENSGYYLEGFCGLHFLRYNNGLVEGNIYPNVTSMSYESFVDDLFDCLEIETATTEIEKEAITVDVFPNPVANHLNIVSGEEDIKEIEVWSISGARVFQKNNLNTKEITLNLTHYAEGIYLVKTRIGDEVVVRKVVKQ